MRRRTVLLLEDDLDLRAEITEILHDAGYRVHAFEHGGGALTYLANGPPPTLILLDLMMPVVDGWKFFSTIQDDPRLSDVPVVVMSTGDRLASAPVSVAYLEKPITQKHLLDAVARACERRAAK
jgi:CheY-like chemotaxis protein